MTHSLTPTGKGPRSAHERGQFAAQLAEVIAARASAEEQRGEVIDRAAAPATEAIPAPQRILIHVQARRPIVMERAEHLARRPDPLTGETLHIEPRREATKRIGKHAVGERTCA